METMTIGEPLIKALEQIRESVDACEPGGDCGTLHALDLATTGILVGLREAIVPPDEDPGPYGGGSSDGLAFDIWNEAVAEAQQIFVLIEERESVWTVNWQTT